MSNNKNIENLAGESYYGPKEIFAHLDTLANSIIGLSESEFAQLSAMIRDADLPIMLRRKLIKIRTYEELRAAAVEAGYDPDEAVTRARTFAASMTEVSTGEAVKLVAYNMLQGRPISVGGSTAS